MGYILVIWAAIGAFGDSYRELKAWTVVGEFSSEQTCIAAAHRLGKLDEREFRCLQK